jgi:hypothetical protein
MEGAMPRERITTCTPAGRNADTGEPVKPPPFDIIVTWNRDGTVQIASTAEDADERLRNWVESVPGDGPVTVTPVAAGQKNVDLVVAPRETKPGTSFRLFDGWHVDLDRRGINQLIRVLRVARDQSFGKDE